MTVSQKEPLTALEEAVLRRKHESPDRPLEPEPVALPDPALALEQVRSGRPGGITPPAIISLQQAAGNQAVQRLLGENAIQRVDGQPEEGPQGSGASPSKAPTEAKKNFLSQLSEKNRKLYENVTDDVFVPLEALRVKGFNMFNQSGRIAFMKDTGGWGEAQGDYESLYAGKYAKKKDAKVKIYTAEGVTGFMSITLRNVSSQAKEGVTGTIEFRVDGIGQSAEFVEFKYKG